MVLYWFDFLQQETERGSRTLRFTKTGQGGCQKTGGRETEGGGRGEDPRGATQGKYRHDATQGKYRHDET